MQLKGCSQVLYRHTTSCTSHLRCFKQVIRNCRSQHQHVRIHQREAVPQFSSIDSTRTQETNINSANFPPKHLLFNLNALPSLPSPTDTDSDTATLSSYSYVTVPPLFPVSLSKPRVCVALSGGVDSSVAALLLRECGYDVECVYMQNWDELDELGQCSGEHDLKDAESVSKSLHLPFHVVSFVREYWHLVFQDLLSGYRHGYTPNPDVLCNREIKFRLLLDWVKHKRQTQTLATGHYARTQHIYNNTRQQTGTAGSNQLPHSPQAAYTKISVTDKQIIDFQLEYISQLMQQRASKDAGSIHTEALLHTPAMFSAMFSTGQPSVSDFSTSCADSSAACVTSRLLTSSDANKDQTYFLSLIRPTALRHLLFPLGSITKAVTRMIATYAGLCTATKSDSMGICMIGKRKFSDFLGNYLSLTSGDFVSLENGEIVGTHTGMEPYTRGQCALIGGMQHKWYVCDKDISTGKVFVVNDRLHPALLHDTVYVTQMNWLSGHIPFELQHTTSGSLLCYCRLRSTEPLRRCRVRLTTMASLDAATVQQLESATAVVHATSDLCNTHLYEVSFVDMPHHLISPGQTIAFYLEDCCLGGGPIAAPGPSYYQTGKVYRLPEDLKQKQQQQLYSQKTEYFA